VHLLRHPALELLEQVLDRDLAAHGGAGRLGHHLLLGELLLQLSGQVEELLLLAEQLGGRAARRHFWSLLVPAPRLEERLARDDVRVLRKRVADLVQEPARVVEEALLDQEVELAELLLARPRQDARDLEEFDRLVEHLDRLQFRPRSGGGGGSQSRLPQAEHGLEVVQADRTGGGPPRLGGPHRSCRSRDRAEAAERGRLARGLGAGDLRGELIEADLGHG